MNATGIMIFYTCLLELITVTVKFCRAVTMRSHRVYVAQFANGLLVYVFA